MGFALRAEADNDVVGRFITVDGTRLHYLDRGWGKPVVLLHGNGSMIGDFVSSGIVERLADSHRVIVFDRPGFGYSERLRGRRWGPSEQADLFSQALLGLGIEQPIVVGHSWGALVALAMALDHEAAGLVLLAGHYYATPRVDARAQRRSAVPFLDPAVREAFAALMCRLMAPVAVRRIFAPSAVPERFERAYSIPHALRPSQMRAAAEEAATLHEAAWVLSRRYKEVGIPVHIIAGSDDRIVKTEEHSERLHRELVTSTFRKVGGCGHMVHHAAPDEVIEAIVEIAEGRPQARFAWPPARKPTLREWLQIGESYEGHPVAVGSCV